MIEYNKIFNAKIFKNSKIFDPSCWDILAEMAVPDLISLINSSPFIVKNEV